MPDFFVIGLIFANLFAGAIIGSVLTLRRIS